MDKIDAFLKAYLKCYENEEKFSAYYNNMLNTTKGKGSQAVKQIQTLMQHKNYVYTKIKGSEFKGFSIDLQVRIVELYYQLVKALIEIIALGWNN
jgi:hypothetical protein